MDNPLGTFLKTYYNRRNKNGGVFIAINKSPRIETPKKESVRSDLLVPNGNDPTAQINVTVLVIVPGELPIVATGTSASEAKELAYEKFWEQCGTDEKFEGTILVLFSEFNKKALPQRTFETKRNKATTVHCPPINLQNS